MFNTEQRPLVGVEHLPASRTMLHLGADWRAHGALHGKDGRDLDSEYAVRWMAKQAGPAESLPPRRAIANLLRLADREATDARVLLVGKSPRNAVPLLHRAVAHILAAVVVSERGWPTDPSEPTLDRIPGENPVKPSLAELDQWVKRSPELTIGKDGALAPEPDRDELRAKLSDIDATLRDVAARFGVDRFGDAPAENAAPIRPEPAPPPPTPLPPPPAPRSPRPAMAVPRPAPAGRNARPRAAREVRPAPKVPAVADPKPEPAGEPAAPTSATPGTMITVAPCQRRTAPSTAFWALIDRWGVPDLAALELLGHPGGLTTKGTRPRFKVTGAEADMLAYLQELEAALTAMGTDPARWIKQPMKAAPFRGATPLAFMTRTRKEGARDVVRFVLQQGLRGSISAGS